jgi:hypothetical protein
MIYLILKVSTNKWSISKQGVYNEYLEYFCIKWIFKGYSTNVAPLKKLFAAVCVERMPVVSTEMNEWKEMFWVCYPSWFKKKFFIGTT